MNTFSRSTPSRSAEICIAPPAGPLAGMDEQAVQSVKDACGPIAATTHDQCTKAGWAWEVAAVTGGTRR